MLSPSERIPGIKGLRSISTSDVPNIYFQYSQMRIFWVNIRECDYYIFQVICINVGRPG